MNYEEKFEVFLDLAKKLNRKFSVIPLLQGSLGLKLQVHDDFMYLINLGGVNR